jgi:hypothetical protein
VHGMHVLTWWLGTEPKLASVIIRVSASPIHLLLSVHVQQNWVPWPSSNPLIRTASALKIAP